MTNEICSGDFKRPTVTSICRKPKCNSCFSTYQEIVLFPDSTAWTTALHTYPFFNIHKLINCVTLFCFALTLSIGFKLSTCRAQHSTSHTSETHDSTLIVSAKSLASQKNGILIRPQAVSISHYSWQFISRKTSSTRTTHDILFSLPFPFTHPALFLHTVLSGGKTITNELISTCHWKACWNAASEWEVKGKKSLSLLNTTVLYWFLPSNLRNSGRYPALPKGESPPPEERLSPSAAPC